LLVDKLQYFESNAKRTQICQDVHGYAQAVRVENLLPLKTLIPIQDNSNSLKKCFPPKPSTASSNHGLSIFNIIINYFKANF
jgi:hypothetical protein